VPKGSPCKRAPGLIPRLLNQPVFISRTKRTGPAEQWLSRLLGLHFGQIRHRAIVSQERCLQRDQGVFHPETLHPRPLKHKQHALVVAHAGAVHQALSDVARPSLPSLP
jgi:hypothetical protein